MSSISVRIYSIMNTSTQHARAILLVHMSSLAHKIIQVLYTHSTSMLAVFEVRVVFGVCVL